MVILNNRSCTGLLIFEISKIWNEIICKKNFLYNDYGWNSGFNNNNNNISNPYFEEYSVYSRDSEKYFEMLLLLKVFVVSSR